jgi:hypothetical protein
MDHCEAGRALAEQWNLPPDFQIVAARHHDPQTNATVDLLTLVHLGCRLADSLGFWVVEPLQPCSPRRFRQSLPPLLAKRIRIDAARWREIVERRIQLLRRPDGGTMEDIRLAPIPPTKSPNCRWPNWPSCACPTRTPPNPPPRTPHAGGYWAALHHPDRRPGLFRREVLQSRIVKRSAVNIRQPERHVGTIADKSTKPRNRQNGFSNCGASRRNLSVPITFPSPYRGVTWQVKLGGALFACKLKCGSVLSGSTAPGTTRGRKSADRMVYLDCSKPTVLPVLPSYAAAFLPLPSQFQGSRKANCE